MMRKKKTKRQKMRRVMILKPREHKVRLWKMKKKKEVPR